MIKLRLCDKDMLNKYYKQKQYIEKVDKNGKHLGFVEKWDMHERGILHRGFGIILIYKNMILLQHRKHPAFDGVLDLSSASHQLLTNGRFENLKDAVIKSLEREWNLSKKDLIGEVKRLGYVYYKQKDPKSIYTEHEYCDVLITEIKKLPKPNYEFAYGYSLVTKEELYKSDSRIYDYMSPWGKKIIEQKMI